MYTPFCTVCPSFLRHGDAAVENADIRCDAAMVREEMKELLQPSENVGVVGKSGAYKVVKDDSLLENGGIEIPTVGRRVYWPSFYKMCAEILEPLTQRFGGFVSERSGQHFHVLTGYLPRDGVHGEVSELEQPLPEIILANLHQLFRRYEIDRKSVV